MSRVLGVLLVVALLAGGCGSPDDETRAPVATTTLPPETPGDLPDLPVGNADLGPGDRVLGRGSELIVDGRTIDLSPLRISDVVVVKGGVFFRNHTELWFTDLRRARATAYADVQSLVASPDGTRFAFLDLEHGPQDGFGTPLAISMAYDATTGRPLVASYAGMGDVTRDDLADLYEDGEPGILGFDADALLVHGATGGDIRIPLDVGSQG